MWTLSRVGAVMDMDPDLGQLRLEHSTWLSDAAAGMGRDLRGHGGGAGSPDGRQRRPQRTKTRGRGLAGAGRAGTAPTSEPFPPITAGAGGDHVSFTQGSPGPGRVWGQAATM